MSRETVEMVRLGVRPPADLAGMPAGAAGGDELEDLRARMIALQGDLAQARAQRDATQGALDKANRDNDALRAELRREQARATEFEALYRAADRSVQRFISRDEARAAVAETARLEELSRYGHRSLGRMIVTRLGTLVAGGVEYYTEDEEE